MSAAREVIQRLEAADHRLSLEAPPSDNPERPRGHLELIVEGPHRLEGELRRAVVEHRDAIKVILLLANPPAWLCRQLNLYAAGTTTTVSRTERYEKRGGDIGERKNTYEVCMTLEAIAASVCCELGMSTQRYIEIVPEVRALAVGWEPDKIVPLAVERDRKPGLRVGRHYKERPLGRYEREQAALLRRWAVSLERAGFGSEPGGEGA